jgi:putative ABC transport system ATP-binding protein
MSRLIAREDDLGNRSGGRRRRRTLLRTLQRMPLIVASELSKTYGRGADVAIALDGVSLTAEAGEWVAVTGPSGCGKSTLLNMLGGLEAPDSGSVTIDGRNLTGRSEAHRARLRRQLVGYVFQQYNLLPDLDVAGNVELPLLLAGSRRRGARSRACEVLEGLGLADRARAYPDELSGGQQQRVAIARALAPRPRVLLADEPTGALDSRSGAFVVAALDDARNRGQTIVMVTHDGALAGVADRIVAMQDARVVATTQALVEVS